MDGLSKLEALVAVIRYIKSAMPMLYGEELAAVGEPVGCQFSLDGPATVRTQVYKATLDSGRTVYCVIGAWNHDPVISFFPDAPNAQEASTLYALVIESMLDRGIHWDPAQAQN